MARARLNGIEIDYEVSGSGPAVLLSHGYSATRRMWDGQHRALEGRHTVISWSMRGHGETESPDDPAQYSEELTVGDMRALLGHVGVEEAIVGGLSLGGYASLGFSLAHPEMVRALVICDSGPGYRNAEARAAWNQRAHERAAELESRGLDALSGRSREMREAMGEHRSAARVSRRAARRLVPDQLDFAILRSRSAAALTVHPRTPRAAASLGPRLARNLARHSAGPREVWGILVGGALDQTPVPKPPAARTVAPSPMCMAECMITMPLSTARRGRPVMPLTRTSV